MDLPKIYDPQGSEQDWDWLVATFGGVKLERAETAKEPGQVFRIVQLQVVEETVIQRILVLDRDGNPLAGMRVVRAWPDAPTLPGWSPPASLWHERGVYGVTNATGEIGFGMGFGDTYTPPSAGASAVWVAEDVGPSDLIDGLGMLAGERRRHLDVTFQLQDVGGKPPTPPSPPAPAPSSRPTLSPESREPAGAEDWATISKKIDRILELLEQQSKEA